MIFLVHETRFGLSWPGERELLAAYAISVLAIFWWFRAFLARTSAWILALALGCFGVSIAFDLFAAPNFLAEHGAKLLGIALWATFLIGTALVDVSRATQRPTQ